MMGECPFTTERVNNHPWRETQPKEPEQMWADSVRGATGLQALRVPIGSSHRTGSRYAWANGLSVIGACHPFAAIFGRLLGDCGAPEELHAAGQDFGPLALEAVSAGDLERTGPQATLDVHLPSLLKVMVAVLG